MVICDRDRRRRFRHGFHRRSFLHAMSCCCPTSDSCPTKSLGSTSSDDNRRCSLMNATSCCCKNRCLGASCWTDGRCRRCCDCCCCCRCRKAQRACRRFRDGSGPMKDGPCCRDAHSPTSLDDDWMSTNCHRRDGADAKPRESLSRRWVDEADVRRDAEVCVPTTVPSPSSMKAPIPTTGPRGRPSTSRAMDYIPNSKRAPSRSSS